MTYSEILKYLERLEIIGIKLGLENINKLMSLSGNPDKKLRFIHIAGTNGKGSTARFMAEILKTSGFKVGLYTSPHLEKIEERIMVNGISITQDELIALATYYRELIEREKDFSPTYFEVITAIALKYFWDKGVDICVMEVGLGGRLDATNVVKPELCVITSISQDHIQYLGHRLSDIAEEKFSIIKPGVSVVASISQKALRERLKDICRRGGNPLMIVGEDIEYNLLRADLQGQIFRLKINGEMEDTFKIRLLGHHQLDNASLAFGGIKMLSQRGFNISPGHIRKGLEDTLWPGRFEIVGYKPYIVLDGAHNLGAIKRLRETLRLYFTDKRIILVIGIMADKDWPRMIRAIVPMACLVLAFRIQSQRACQGETLAEEARKFNRDVTGCSSIKEAISIALENAQEEDVICITGSLYAVGEAKKFFNYESA